MIEVLANKYHGGNHIETDNASNHYTMLYVEYSLPKMLTVYHMRDI